MIKKITHLAKNPIISGSAIIFLSTTASNFFHFLFNLFMSRNLSVANYGLLASLNSLIALTGIFSAALMPTILKFAAEHFANDEHEKAKTLFIKTTQFLGIIGGVILCVFYFFQQNIASFFNFTGNNQLIVITGFVALASFLFTANNSFVQAKLQFGYLSFLIFFSAVLKFSLGAIFVIIGWQVYGAMYGLFFSSLIPYMFSFIPLRFVFSKNKNKLPINMKQLFSYGLPAALCTFSLTSLISTDLILVKHFFDPKNAGYYAGVALIGKVIFFFSLPIASTMFPVIVQKYTKNEKYQGIFFLSLGLLFACCFAISLFYFLFPQFVIIFFLKRPEYFAISAYVGIFGLFISLYSVLYLLVNFFLSIKQTQIFIPLLLGAFSQIMLIWNFHSSFTQVIWVNMSIVSLLLIYLLIYYFTIQRNSN